MKNSKLPNKSNNSPIILYTTSDGTVKIDTVFRDETIWLTQKKMAELFGVKRPAITKHLKNIFKEGELAEKVVSSILEHTTKHGLVQDQLFPGRGGGLIHGKKQKYKPTKQTCSLSRQRNKSIENGSIIDNGQLKIENDGNNEK